jgi:alginate O-acetyltransferase complex protein AlgJ
MRAYTRHAAFAIFLLLALTPVVLFGINGPWLADSAGPALRPSTPFPHKLVAGTFRSIGQWFSDRAGMRYPLILIGNVWQFVLWQRPANDNVRVGNLPWLFWSDYEGSPAAWLQDVRGRLRLRDAEILQLDRRLSDAKAYLAACNTRFFVFIAPNKQSIYPDELLGTGTSVETRLDNLLARLSPAARETIIDPRPELRAQKWHGRLPVYLKTDTHWNTIGSFIGYQTIVRTLARVNAIDHADFAILDRYDIVSAGFARGDLAARIQLWSWLYGDEERVELLPKDGTIPAVDRTHDPILRNPAGRGRLLFLGDSFSPPLAYFLARHFQEVDFLLHSVYLDPARLAQEHFDVVLIEVVERNLHGLQFVLPRNFEHACVS